MSIYIAFTGVYIAVGVCCSIGVLMLIFAFKRFIETMVFLRASLKASGTVVNLATARNSDGHTMYLPVIEFKTAGGANVRFNSTVASQPPAYSIGEKVEIRFLRKNPQAAKINSFWEIWMVTLVVGAIGVVCLIAALLIFLGK